ncbi:MAG: hypothetical protein L0241_01750, partial [Planctomycetia bacterium]|nr:hypothetical protein [Planctomycetia bacterium]
MTEVEWFQSQSPVAMLAHLGANPNDRRVLLYASALCLHRPELLTGAVLNWFKFVEIVLAGEMPEAALDAVQESAEAATSHLGEFGSDGTRAHYSAIGDVVFASWLSATEEYEYEEPIPEWEKVPARTIHCQFLRDIFGNPFRPVTFNSSWRTDTALSLARQMYESREFSAMPILADALQDAG